MLEGIKPYWVAPDDSLVLCILFAVLILHKPLALVLEHHGRTRGWWGMVRKIPGRGGS